MTESKKFATCCPRDVLEDLLDGIKKVETSVLEAENQIAAQLDNNISVIETGWSEFCHPAPTLTAVPRDHLGAYAGMGTWGGDS